MRQQNFLDYSSIKLAISELTKVGEFNIVEKLKTILINNELPKPDKHNKKSDPTTSYFKIELNENELEKILDLFLDLEVGSLDENYESTTSIYSDMVSVWSSIKPTKV